MVSITVDIDDSSFRQGFRVLSKELSSEVTSGDAVLTAEEIIRRSIDSPIPSELRALANSAVVIKTREKVTFGFNSRYAFFQDSPGRSVPWIIVPRVKKVLYIPISPKGRRLHRRGNNPDDEGLERGVDYVLRSKVVIPIKPYGSAIGPNHFFSETIRRNVDFIFESISDSAGRRLAKKFKSSKKRLPAKARGK